ncbi:hypothetical protein H7Y40_00885 [Pedobacter sp.]|nr:hypothetical protein [Candidatus Saccharibacteria bacterium]
MSALQLRNILLTCVILLLGGIGTLIYFASGFLHEETVTTTHARIDAELGEQDIDKLKNLEKVLATNTASIQKADQIVSESKQYEYQDQIVNDINAYAARTGVKIIGYDFSTAATTTTPAVATTPTTPQVSGVKTLNVTLSLQSPMPFDNYLRFVKAIEKNLTKMQVSGINISPDDKISSSITNPSVILIVYVR